MLSSDRVGNLMGAVALGLFVGALGFQYLGHLPPCPLCHWQRWAHITAAILGLVCIPLWKNGTPVLAAAAILFVALSGLIAAYQVGEQLDIFPELAVCKVDHPYMMGSAAIPVVLCKDVGWSLFGLSLAAYNALISLTTALLGAFFLAKGTERSRHFASEYLHD